MKIFSEAFLGGLKRQAILKALALLIDALIDFKQTYQNRTDPSNKSQNVTEQNHHNHL